MKLLELLARWCAVAAGALLTVITLMTCASVVGRNTTGWTVAGDFELAGSAAGAAIALFLPWCQWRRGNIIVDFFTTGAAAATRRRLDRLGAALLGAAMALLAWRSALGGLSAWKSQSGSMMLGFPEWIVYAGIVPSLALTAAIALVQAWRGFGDDDGDTAGAGADTAGAGAPGTAGDGAADDDPRAGPHRTDRTAGARA